MAIIAIRVRRLSAAAWTIVPPCVGFAAVVGVWWLAVRVLAIDAYLVPAPPDVVAAGRRAPVYLLEQGWVTLAETVAGFVVAAGAGVAVGIALASSRLVERTLYPLLLTINAVPKVALAPLLIVWMGFGAGPKVTMVALVCFFPIVIATATGLVSTPAELDDLARALTASRWKAFVKIRLPHAVPQIFIGLKTAMPLASVGAIIGEFAGGSDGLGFVIARSSGSGDVAMAFAAIALLCGMSIALFYVIRALERFLPWVPATAVAD